MEKTKTQYDAGLVYIDAQLLMTVIQKIAQTKKAFSVVSSLIRIYLISMLDMVELLRSINRAYKAQVGEPPGQLQLNLI